MEQMELLYQSLQYEALITIISGVQNSSREQTYGAI